MEISLFEKLYFPYNGSIFYITVAVIAVFLIEGYFKTVSAEESKQNRIEIARNANSAGWRVILFIRQNIIKTLSSVNTDNIQLR